MIWLRDYFDIDIDMLKNELWRAKKIRIETLSVLTHWGRVTHICVSKLASIVSDNGLSPGRRQAIIWTNAGILLIGTLGTNFSEILTEIHIFSFKKMRLKVSSAKRRPFCLGLNVLKDPHRYRRLMVTEIKTYDTEQGILYQRKETWHNLIAICCKLMMDPNCSRK